MRINILLIFAYVVVLLTACTPSCSSELTKAQCANQGVHEYIRTYEFIDGCGKAGSLVPGVSEFTWTFSEHGDSITSAALLPNRPVPPDKLITVETDIYGLATDNGQYQSQVYLNEDGFVWQMLDRDSNDLCYQIIYTLSK